MHAADTGFPKEEILQIRRWKLFTLVVACFLAPAAAKADPVVWAL
jgi:hypothetical protein